MCYCGGLLATVLAFVLGYGVQLQLFNEELSRSEGKQFRHRHQLRDLGITPIAADSPASFLDDGPTSKLIRQILGAVAEFDKAVTVAKLKGARDRVRRRVGKCEGRKSYAERDPDMVALAKEIKCRGGRVSLREIAAELEAKGYVTPSGKPYSASAVASMLA